MINLQVVNQFMYENFERVKTTAGGTHFHARCLLCGDSKKSKSKKRFHLDWKNGEPVWQCFNCDRSGGFIRLFCLIKGVSFDDAKKTLYSYDPTRLKKTLSSRNQTSGTHKIDQDQIGYNSIINDCINESTSLNFSVQTKSWINILKDFRVDRKIPDNIKLYYAHQGQYRGRIIIPIFNKYNDVTFFQARRLPGSDVDPKYKNPASQKSLIILNENKFRNDRYIIVAEGLIDAFTVGNQGTTCLGKSISDEFIARLFELTNKGVIISFDNDLPGRESLDKFMRGDQRNWSHIPNKYAKQVKYFLMPKGFCQCENRCKDINKFSTKHETGDVYDFIVKNSYSFTKAFVQLKLGGM